MHRTALPLVLISALLPGLLLSSGAVAAPDTTQGKAAEPVAAAVSSEPGQTSATYGDWVLRCERLGQGDGMRRVCEVAQSLVIQGQQAPIAQLAFGHPLPKTPDDKGGAQSPGDSLMLTVLVPTNITFAKPPVLASTKDGGSTLGLTFRRCLPGGCFADAMPDGAFLKGLHSSKPGTLTFTDAAGRSIALPVSFRGLAQALDEFAKEKRADAGKVGSR